MSINITILVITILFIVLTLSGAEISQLYSALVVSENGNVVIYVGGCFTFSFIMRLQSLFLATNKEFSRKLKYLQSVINKFTSFNLSKLVKFFLIAF